MTGRVSLACALAGTLLACGTVSKKDGAGDGDGGPGDGDGGLSGAVHRTCVEASGDRLRWRVRTVGGGVAEHIEMVDTAFDVRCTFEKAPDGKVRCLPVQEPPVAFGFVEFADDDCTDKIVDLRGDVDTTEYAVSPEYQQDGECSGGDRYHFWPLGDYLGNLAGGTIYYVNDMGDCEGVAVFGDSYTFFDIEDEIPTATFVEGTVSQTDSGRVSVRQIEGDDGSRYCDERRAFLDEDLDTACWPQLAEDGALRCIPEGGSLQTVYTDEECKEDTLSIISSYAACDTHSYVTETVTNACGDRWRVMPYGDELTEMSYYQQEGPGDNCYESTPSDTQTVYSVDEPVAPDTLARFTRTCLPAGDRLETCLRGTDDGLAVIERGPVYSNDEGGTLSLWRDTEVGTMCSFRGASDGVSRCLPVRDAEAPVATVRTMYTDEAECKVEVEVGVIDPACGDGAPTMAVDDAFLDTDEVRVFDLKGPYEGTLYMPGIDGCMPAVEQAYELGFEIDPDTFHARGLLELDE